MAGFVLWAPGRAGGLASEHHGARASPQAGSAEPALPAITRNKGYKTAVSENCPRPVLTSPGCSPSCPLKTVLGLELSGHFSQTLHVTLKTKAALKTVTRDLRARSPTRGSGSTSFTPRSHGDSQCLSGTCPASCATPVLPGLPSLAPQGTRAPPCPIRSPALDGLQNAS